MSIPEFLVACSAREQKHGLVLAEIGGEILIDLAPFSLAQVVAAVGLYPVPTGVAVHPHRGSPLLLFTRRMFAVVVRGFNRTI